MHRGPTFGLLIAIAAGVTACTPAPARAAPAPAGGAPLSPVAVRAFLDRTLPAQLAQLHIPGAAVSVLSAGRPVLSAGYGSGDLTTRRPVDAGRTAMEMGSVAKVFTAVAVLQQVERGRLDLDTDVNRYLDRFAVVDAFPGRPVTLAHLLTHTSGFATFNVGIAAAAPATANALGTWLAEHQPRRVRPPGLLPAYDNYGVALAGHLVELASGETFAAYVDRHILRPLRMGGTSFDQPVPPALEVGRATGHRFQGGQHVVAEARYGPMPPAGSGPVTTAEDMARFAAALFSADRFPAARSRADQPFAQSPGSGPILGDAMLALLHRRHFAVDDRLSAMALIFEDQRYGADRILLKDGTTTGFHSKLIVAPDRGVALYVSYNGLGDGGGARLAGARLVSSFLDTFLPASTAPAPTVAEPVGRYAGTYRTTRTPDADVTRIQALFDNVVVTANDDGTVTVSGAPTADPARESRRWRPIGAALFQEENGTDRIAFRTDRRGHVTTLVAGQEPSEAYQRLSRLDSPVRDLWLLATAWTIVVVSVLVVPVRAAVRRFAGRSGPADRNRWRTASVIAIWAAAMAAAMTAAVLTSLLGDGAYEGLVTGRSALLVALDVTSASAVVLSIAATGGLVLTWRRRWWGLPTRSGLTIAVAAPVMAALVQSRYGISPW